MARKSSPGTLAVTIIVVLCAAVVPLLLYALWEFWPTAAVLKTDAGTVDFFGFRHTVSTEVRLFVVVAIGGALGGVLHSTRSVAWYVGHGNLKWRWVPFYLVTIVLGAGLATILYLVIRGGLFQGAGISDANPYGFVALGALVGLFTEQALVMLRKIATDVFAEAETGSDSTKLIATTGDATNVEDVSASLTGEVAAETGPVTYQFEYGTTPAYGSQMPDPPVQLDEPTVSVDLAGLTPSTEYHYRLVVTNSADKTAEGSDKTFTTKAAAEESPPTNG